MSNNPKNGSTSPDRSLQSEGGGGRIDSGVYIIPQVSGRPIIRTQAEQEAMIDFTRGEVARSKGQRNGY